MTRKDLEDYWLLEDVIREYERKIHESEFDLYRSPSFDGAAGAARPHSALEDAVIKKVDVYIEYVAEKAKFERAKRRVELYISGIDDLFTRRVFVKRYLQRKKWQTIADEFGGGNTKDSVRKICERYLEKHPEENF